MLALVIAHEPFCEVVCHELIDYGLDVESGTSYSNIVETLQKNTYRIVVVQGGVISEEQIASINTLAKDALVCTFMHIEGIKNLKEDLLLRTLITAQIENLVARHCLN